jgi:hypothetical protein
VDETAKLNSLAKSEIETLAAEGISLTPEEVVEINALGWAVHNPETRRMLSRGRPVPLAGHYLWPLTMRAVDWLDANKYSIGQITPAMGYAMCYGRSEGPELEVYGEQADKSVKRWFKSLRANMDEFVEAVRQVDYQDLRPDLPSDTTGRAMSMGDFSAFLAATCGADADFWERRASMGYCLAVLSTFVMQNHADKRPCMQDPKIIAERALGFAIEKIRASRSAERIMHQTQPLTLVEVPHG